MREIDIVAYKVESFDSDCFMEDIVSCRPNSIILLFNKNQVCMVYKPLNCKINNRKLKFFRLNNPKLDYYFYPLSFIIDNFIIFKLFLTIFLKYRVKVVLVENTYVASMVGIMRKCHLVKKMIYLPGDWLAGSKAKKGIWSNVGNNIIFPFFDYWACRLGDVTLNITKYITEARYNYWKKTISKKELVFQNHLKIKQNYTDPNRHNRKIVFIGNIRKDSGLELAITSLRIIRINNLDITFKIIGPYSERIPSLERLGLKYKVDKYVEFLGFVERDKFGEILSDCFCGMDLIMTNDSYTTKTLPAKFFDYLQYLLPVIVTKKIGPIVEIVQDNKLGLVIEPNEDRFVEAVIKIYEAQAEYRNNIIKYINSFQGLNIVDFLG